MSKYITLKLINRLQPVKIMTVIKRVLSCEQNHRYSQPLIGNFGRASNVIAPVFDVISQLSSNALSLTPFYLDLTSVTGEMNPVPSRSR